MNFFECCYVSLFVMNLQKQFFKNISLSHFTIMLQWRIIACESSDYRHIVHDDGFVWLMFVHERFSASEQTLNSQNHGVHYMSVITRLTCNNSILLTRKLPRLTNLKRWHSWWHGSVYFWHCLRDDGFTLMAFRAFTKETYVRLSWYTHDNVCDSFRDVITSWWAFPRASNIRVARRYRNIQKSEFVSRDVNWPITNLYSPWKFEIL